MWPNYQRLPLPPEKKNCGHHQVMRRHQKNRRWNHDRNTVEICRVHPFSKVASFRNICLIVLLDSFGFFWLDFNGWNHCFGSENWKNPRIALRLCHSQDLPSHHKCVGGWRQMHSWAISCCHFCAGDDQTIDGGFINFHVFNDPGTKVYPLVIANSLLLKMAIYSEFSHQKWWFSRAMLNYQRVDGVHKPPNLRLCLGLNWDQTNPVKGVLRESLQWPAFIFVSVRFVRLLWVFWAASVATCQYLLQFWHLPDPTFNPSLKMVLES